VNDLSALIRDEILKHGPMRFSRFMELALYEPHLGYYRRDRDPFGRQGDFYTAEQLQPVFGRLMAVAVDMLDEELGCPEDFTVLELGAGRGEMANAFSNFRYIPVEVGHTDTLKLPESFNGVVFSNEFFDAQPVDLAVRSFDGWVERRVGVQGSELIFLPGPGVDETAAEYLAQYAAGDQQVVELHLKSIEQLRWITARLTKGFVLTVDYGYTARESIRFPQGSLMSYHRHQASEDVLKDPGDRDITSHVPFQVLEQEGKKLGLEKVRQETLAQFLISLGEESFIRAVEGGHELQLKTLLFGMGESFRVLLQEKTVG
jgi:SAM-dependent MidA family methyltransferase